MKNYKLLFLPLTLVAASLQAMPRDINEARRLATDVLGSSTPIRTAASAASLTTDEPRLLFAAPTSAGNTEPAYYIFTSATGEGFVAVAGEDRMPNAVIGYALDAEPGDELPPALDAYLSDYAMLVEAVRQGAVLSSTSAASTEKTAISPLISTTWAQGAPFSDMTPNNYVSGCVATAMAMVMKYYNYPAHGYGSAAPSKPTGIEAVDLSTSTYDWANMRASYSRTYTTAQGKAVALLMRDAGYAVAMSYAESASGSYSSHIPWAMVQHFNYSPDSIADYDRDSWSTTGWINMIRTELSAKRPIIYSGSSLDGGHCFICDGIDANDYLHINWGWAGKFNGYFDMNILNPENYDIVSNKTQAFYYSQDVVVGIKPGDPDADYSEWYPAPALYDYYCINTVDEQTGVVTSPLTSTNRLQFKYTLVNTSGRSLNASNYVPYLVAYNTDGSVYSKVKDSGFSTLGIVRMTTRTLNVSNSLTSNLTVRYALRFLDPTSTRPDSLRDFVHGDLVKPIEVKFYYSKMTTPDVDRFISTGDIYLASAEVSGTLEAGVAAPAETKLNITLYNPSKFALDFQNNRVALIPANDNLVATGDSIFLNTSLSYQIYSGAEVPFVIPLEGVTLAAGRYIVAVEDITSPTPLSIVVASPNALDAVRSVNALLRYDATSKTLTAADALAVTIFTPSGSVAARLALQPNVPTRVDLPSGIYIVDSEAGRTKIAVR